MCLPLQRYTFWSNSQLSTKRVLTLLNCACHCKDTHFEAIHNPRWGSSPWAMHCACHCKDTHFEAIHNSKQPVSSERILCLPLQRYTFWSNSQPAFLMILSVTDCACHCKDTHFEAIHNCYRFLDLLVCIVLATAKIHILKQFTTEVKLKFEGRILCLPLQRYTFWSNSQLLQLFLLLRINCACHCKDTHFEASHNFFSCFCCCELIVLATAKIHILKQFTTTSVYPDSYFYCACHCKDTHFEAIHNLVRNAVMPSPIVLATAKIHILKQFTTWLLRYTSIIKLCLPLQRYTFWSNSQQQYLMTTSKLNCACHCKDTHFEAIHNQSLSR